MRISTSVFITLGFFATPLATFLLPRIGSERRAEDSALLPGAEIDDHVLRLPFQKSRLNKRQSLFSTGVRWPVVWTPSIEVSVGDDTPQRVLLDLNTGSGETWVYWTGSETGGGSGTFDPLKSSSGQCSSQTFTASYADNTNVSGVYCNESLTIAGHTVKNLQIGVVNKTASQVKNSYGILGLSFSGLQHSVTKHPTLIDQMYSQKIIPSRAYGIFLNRSDAASGEITFGGVDRSRYNGTITRLPMVLAPRDGSQMIQVGWSHVGYRLKNRSYDWPALNYKGYPNLLLDTGSALSKLPNDVINRFAMRFNLFPDPNDSSKYFVDCGMRDWDGGLEFSLGESAGRNVTIHVPFSEAAWEYNGTICQFGYGNGTSFTLGLTFLQSAYLYVDIGAKEVGLAQAKWN